MIKIKLLFHYLPLKTEKAFRFNETLSFILFLFCKTALNLLQLMYQQGIYGIPLLRFSALTVKTDYFCFKRTNQYIIIF